MYMYMSTCICAFSLHLCCLLSVSELLSKDMEQIFDGRNKNVAPAPTLFDVLADALTHPALLQAPLGIGAHTPLRPPLAAAQLVDPLMEKLGSVRIHTANTHTLQSFRSNCACV